MGRGSRRGGQAHIRANVELALLGIEPLLQPTLLGGVERRIGRLGAGHHRHGDEQQGYQALAR